MSVRHSHRPAPGTRSDYPDRPADEYRVPYAARTVARCAVCGRSIVFVAGYELRRDYWRLRTDSD